jgi:hypothetical protein
MHVLNLYSLITMTSTLKLTYKDLQKLGYYTDIPSKIRFAALLKGVQRYPPFSILQYLQNLKLKNKNNSILLNAIEKDIEQVVDKFLMHEHKAAKHHGFPYMWLYSEIVHNAKEYEEYGDSFYIDNILICFDKILSMKYKLNNFYDKKKMLQMSKLLNSKKFNQQSKLGLVRLRKLKTIFTMIAKKMD